MRRKREGQEACDAQREFTMSGIALRLNPAFSYRIEEKATRWIQLL